jgi:large subunit ribosomal protein L15
VGQLDVFDDGSEVTVDALRENGLLKGQFDRLKVLGGGELSKKLTVKAHGFSASASAKIEKAGGKAEVVSLSQAQLSQAQLSQAQLSQAQLSQAESAKASD